MKMADKLIVVLGVVILVLASIGVFYWNPEEKDLNIVSMEEIYSINGVLSKEVEGITVSSENPFYSLIASPLAIHYDSNCNRSVKPLYVKDFEDTSRAISRAEEQIAISSDLFIQDNCIYGNSAKEISIGIAKEFWESSNALLILEDSKEGYNLGVVAAPIASYLTIPVIVTDKIDGEVLEVIQKLDVKYNIICGNLESYGSSIMFKNPDDIVNQTIELVKERFGELNYITLANPLDINKAEVLSEESYTFEGTVSSNSFTMSNIVGMGTGLLKGISPFGNHEFNVSSDYKYARLKFSIENLVDENVDETGSQLSPILFDPDGNNIGYLFTAGGIPERNSDGEITKDKLDFETIIYDKPGTYSLMVTGKFLTKKHADYKIHVTVENLKSAVVPNMPGLSSIAPYLTAYHKGIVFAKPEFAFVADEDILKNPTPGVAFPAANPGLINESNEHVFNIHNSLNNILAKIQDVDLKDEEDLRYLREYYDESPAHIAILGDARMIPHYYYYDTPDANTRFYGWDVASDFIYGNIDQVPRDDRISIHPKDIFIDERYGENYPHQENIVGRITGWDVQDASALVLRTIFYNDILKNMENEEWKNNALVQTGSGTEFQRLPIIDLWRRVAGGIFGVHDLPIKWPTGESHFTNLIVQDSLKPGDFNIKSTENTESMRKGLSDKTLKEINRMGILNMLLFPKIRARMIAGESSSIYDINGEQDLEDSNFIYTFGHGQPMGYSHGDVQTNSIGFRPVILQNLLNRASVLLPSLLGFYLTSGLGNVGSYNVRYVENMDLGPSVMFVHSCYIGRIDGFHAKSCVSQAYLHSGINAFIASSRGSPGPGYLDARKRPIGLGISEYIKTKRNPDLHDAHFCALYIENIFEELTGENADVGTAFRNARNKFMDDADSEFFWTPPLSLDIQTIQDYNLYKNNVKLTSETGDNKCMEKKYTCQLEFNLLGDPAFNPYVPNEG